MARSMKARLAMARAGALLWAIGGALAISAGFFPQAPGVNVRGIVWSGIAALVIAAAYAAVGHRLPAIAHRLSPALGTAAITSLVWFGHGTSLSASFPILYVWVALYAAYFLRRADVIANVLLIAFVHGATLIVQSGSLPPSWYLSTGTVAVTGGMVHALVGRLHDIARTDGLTELLNRRGLDEALRLEHYRAGRQRTPLSVAILDVDHFKELNDRFGHEVGDGVLRQLAGAWTERLRATDVLARYGGDEFVLLLPGAAEADALIVVERLRAAVPDGITISAGIAEWDRAESGEVLLRRADLALYCAKEAGRDRSDIAPRTGTGPLAAVEDEPRAMHG